MLLTLLVFQIVLTQKAIHQTESMTLALSLQKFLQTAVILRILRGGTFDGRKSSDLRSPLNDISVGEVERVGIECDNHALSHSKTERQGNGFYGIHSRLWG
jgi:hypothetical protein